MDDVIERIARHLRRPVQIDPALDRRVMREINALPTPGDATALQKAWGWLTRPHQVTLTPLGGLAAAAVFAIVGLLSPGSPAGGVARLSVRPGRPARDACVARRRLQRLGRDPHADATERERGALDGGATAHAGPVSLRLLRGRRALAGRPLGARGPR